MTTTYDCIKNANGTTTEFFTTSSDNSLIWDRLKQEQKEVKQLTYTILELEEECEGKSYTILKLEEENEKLKRGIDKCLEVMKMAPEHELELWDLEDAIKSDKLSE